MLLGLFIGPNGLIPPLGMSILVDNPMLDIYCAGFTRVIALNSGVDRQHGQSGDSTVRPCNKFL